MFALLFLASSSAFIDVWTCQTVGTTLKFMPSINGNMLGDWQMLTPPSSMYMSDFMVQMNNSILRLVSKPTLLAPLAALEYMLPTQNDSTSHFWLYEVSYNCIQSAGNTSSQFGIGPWNAIGFDWLPSGSTPNLTALRFASGTTDGRVQNSVVRVGNNVTAVEDIMWSTRNVSDVKGELRSFKYRYVYDGTVMFPTSLQTDFGETAVMQQIETTAPRLWQSPTRMVVVASSNVLFVSQFALTRTEYSCTTSTTQVATTRAVGTTPVVASAPVTVTVTDASIATMEVVTHIAATSLKSSSTAKELITEIAPASAPTTTESYTMLPQLPPRASSAGNWVTCIVAVLGIALVLLVIVSSIYQLKRRVSVVEQQVNEPVLVENPKSVYGPINIIVVRQAPEVIYDKVLVGGETSNYGEVPKRELQYDSPTSELKI